jgi:hypothetical protein
LEIAEKKEVKQEEVFSRIKGELEKCSRHYNPATQFLLHPRQVEQKNQEMSQPNCTRSPIKLKLTFDELRKRQRKLPKLWHRHRKICSRTMQ